MIYLIPVILLSLLILRASRRAGAFYVVLAVVAVAAAIETLGLPRPIWAEWRGLSEVEVIAQTYEPGVAIYVWTKGNGGPVAYRLPWDEETARQGQEAERQQLPYVMDYDPDKDRPKFYAMPQFPDPPKTP